MTVSSTVRRAGPFLGNGTQTVFPFEFKVLNPDDLLVALSLGTSAMGVDVVELEFNQDYFVQLNVDQESAPGGVIILNTPLAIEHKLAIISDRPYVQEVALTNLGGFFPQVINTGLDNTVIQTQQLSEALDRAIKVPVTDGRSADEYWKDSMEFIEDAKESTAEDAASALDSAQRAEAAQQDIHENWQEKLDAAAEAADTATTASSAASIARDQAVAAASMAMVESDLFPDEPSGRAAVADGAYFAVVGTGYIASYLYRRNNTSSSTLVNVYPSANIDSNTINSGKDLPLKRVVRDGIISDPDVVNRLNDWLLGLKIFGADEDYYYRLGYYANGTTGFPGGADAVAIYKYKRDTYATASVREAFINTDVIVPQIVRDGTVQAVYIKSGTEVGAGALLVVDTSKMPVSGTAINYETPLAVTRSWIVDPSQYEYAGGGGSSANQGPILNAVGVDFPLLRVVRDGIVSDPDVIRKLNDWLLDIQIIGANPDYVYRFGYYANGVNAFPGGPDAMAIYKYKKDTYETVSVREGFINTTVVVPPIVRDGGQKTVVLKSDVDPGAWAIVTFHTGNMPVPGAAINYETNPSAVTRSWIINPAQCVPATQSSSSSGGNAMSFDYTAATKVMRYAYQSGNKLYRVSIGPNSYNKLPNIKTVEAANYAIAPSYSTLFSTTGDSLPPVKIKATMGNLEVAPRLTYSGGNHGRQGADKGYRTALNILLQYSVDGVLIDMSKDLAGSCDKVGIEIVNSLRACNTVDSQPVEYNGTTYDFTGAETDPPWIEGMVEPPSDIRRYVLNQCFNITCTPYGMAVEGRMDPLEPGVKIFEDNALQMFTGGFNSTIMYANGLQGERIPFEPDVWPPNSGPSSTYPNAWLVVFKGTGGMAGIWIDKEYGIGDGRYIDPPRYNFQTNDSGKCYAAVVRAPLTGPGGGYDFENGGYDIGDDYVWRGGYFWSHDTATAEFDSIVPHAIGGEQKFAYVKPDSSAMRF